jgi:GDP/UDP-N,N'-diacetylbacillosamine 2-epimerase (hydrolysing)
MKKICVITGTRAEYGLLANLLEELNSDPRCELQLIVTGSHLVREFGNTYNEISERFTISKKIEILLSSDSGVAIAKSMGLGLISFADAFAELQPDLIAILGDRFEILSAASAALAARIPLAHISGGEITEGAFDDAIRHSLSKMSHLHFVSTETYRKRVLQMGEEPQRVFLVGSLSVDSMAQLKLLDQAEVEKHIGFKFAPQQTILCTYHPVTLNRSTASVEFSAVLQALDCLADSKVIFTKANADPEGKLINELLTDYVAHNPQRAVCFDSMGQLLYLSTMKYVDLVLGNSSSGIVEAPFFATPTVNIGNRQAGRLRSDSIVDCRPDSACILNAIKTVASQEFKNNCAAFKNN